MKMIFNQKYKLFEVARTHTIYVQKIETIDSLITKNLDYTKYLQEYKSDHIEKEKNKSVQKDEIDKLSTFEDIVQYSINAIKVKDDYLFKRIYQLKELCDLEEDYDVLLESLKGMFLFVGLIGNFSKPTSLTVSESGFFYLEWERDRNNSLTVRFKNDYLLDYVIFKPSSHINKRIILNGSMNILDLIDYLKALSITIHQEI